MLPNITIHFIVNCNVSFRLYPCRLFQFWLSGDLFYFCSFINLFLSKFKVSFFSLVFRTKQRVFRHAWWRAICASEEALSLYMRVVSVLFLTSWSLLVNETGINVCVTIEGLKRLLFLLAFINLFIFSLNDFVFPIKELVGFVASI